MTPFHLLRRAVRTGSWALAIGTVAAIVYSLLIVALVSVWPESDALRAALVALLEAAVIFAITWLAGLVVELSDRAGLLTGLWSQLLPALVVLIVEGPLGLEPQLIFRVAGLGLGALAGLLAARISRRRRPGAGGAAESAAGGGPAHSAPEGQAERADSGPPSAPTG